MITNQKGLKMLDSVSPIYGQNKVMLAIYEAVGREAEATETIIDEIALQLFPQTATWGLKYWEEALSIPVNESLTLENRRTKILVKMQTRWPVTKQRMEAIINNFITSKNAYIQEIYEEYMFKIHIPLPDERIYYRDLIETVEEVKPAHLAYEVEGTAGNNIIAVKQLWARNFINYLMCGTFYPKDDEYWTGRSFNRKTATNSTLYSFEVEYLICGTFYPGGDENIGRSFNRKVGPSSKVYNFDVTYPICGTFNAGEVV